MAFQGTPAPFFRDDADEPMAEPIPFARACRKMTHVGRNARLGGQCLKGHFPPTFPTIIATAAIPCNHQAAYLGEAGDHHLDLPATNTDHSELGGIAGDTHADPTLVADQIIHAAGNRFAHLLVQKVVDTDFRVRFFSETLELSEIRYNVIEPSFRSNTITIATTLTDGEQYSKENISQQFSFR